MRTAIIDVGSNSVRYAVMEEDTVIADKQIISTVLADGLFFSGNLKADAISRTADAVKLFCDRAKTDNADEILIFATEAVRAAKNGCEFTKAVYRAVGLRVDVLDGVTEAQIGFTGAASGSSGCAVFDLGGASCEIMRGGSECERNSYPVGCVRLRDGSGGSRSQAEKILSRVIPASLPAAARVIGIGGTATALGAMLVCPDCYDPRSVHGSTVTKDFLFEVADGFFCGGDLKARYGCLTANRAALIGYGALACISVLNALGANCFTVSERDNLEGYYEYKKSKRA